MITPLNDELRYDESEALKRLAQGDEKAFRMIYDRYRKKIASFAWLLTESEELTDQILQDVFVKLWINRSKLDGVNNFNAWLIMTVYFQFIVVFHSRLNDNIVY